MSGQKELIQFVLDRSSTESVAMRLRLYRTLVQICGDPNEATGLSEMARALELADARCREFAFALARKEEGI